jgi:hypothetical protein
MASLEVRLYRTQVIKILIVSGVFIFQACQTDNSENEIQNVAKENFLTSLKLSSEKMNFIKIRNSKSTDFYSKTMGDTQTICLQFMDSLNISEDTIIEDLTTNLNSVSDVLEARTSLGLLTQYDIVRDTDIVEVDLSNDTIDDTTAIESSQNFDINECVGTIEIPIQPIIDALNPAIQNAKDYLNSKGMTNIEIDAMIASENGQEEDLVPLAMMMAYDEENTNTTAYNYLDIFITPANSQITWGDTVDCAAAAIGVDLIWSVGSSTAKWSKKSIKKLFKSVAKRFLGPIGVAFAVISFTYCMVKAYTAEINYQDFEFPYNKATILNTKLTQNSNKLTLKTISV